jgi:hypothetical protein
VTPPERILYRDQDTPCCGRGVEVEYVWIEFLEDVDGPAHVWRCLSCGAELSVVADLVGESG